MAIFEPSEAVYIADGVTRTFGVPFPVLDESDLYVSANGAPVTFYYENARVTLPSSPSKGVEVRVYRNTEGRYVRHEFKHGAPLTPEYLDENFRQGLYVTQEAFTDAANNTENVRAELQLAVDALELMDVQLQDQIDLLAKEDNLQQEIQARKDADAILQGQIYLRATVVQLNQEIRARQAADAHLQAQISAAEPLGASAFSPISWHDQSIQNSVTVPPNKNAWSFGPTMTIAEGQAVTVSEGSFWTIANGEV